MWPLHIASLLTVWHPIHSNGFCLANTCTFNGGSGHRPMPYLPYLLAPRAYIVNTPRGKNGLQAFDNNPAESELTSMKSGTMWAKCGRLALADFLRDPRSSDSLGWIVFFQKTQKMLTKFPGLATSSRHNFAMITAGTSRPNGPFTGCIVSIFTVSINSKSFP